MLSKKQSIDNSFDLEDISETMLNSLDKKKNTLHLARSNTLNKTIVEKILQEISETYQFNSTFTAFVIVAIFCQQGATSRNSDGNMTCNYDGEVFKLADIRKILNKYDTKNSFRRFARTSCEQIASVCIRLNVEGNLVQFRDCFLNWNFPK